MSDAPEDVAACDQKWLAEVYRKDEPQLTWRAALTGMILGGLLSASNLYIGLKIGWSFGMGITSAVVGFAVFAALGRVFPRMAPLTMLENNTSQTTASAAAYMCSAGLVSSFPAMIMLQREGVPGVVPLEGAKLVAFLLAISLLGVVVAIPLKRSLINIEQLRFPSGIVCAETIRLLHQQGSEASAASLKRARALFSAAGIAAVLKFIFDCKLAFLRKLPDVIAFPGAIRGHGMSAWSFGANTSLLLYGAGAIIGIKAGLSLALGAIANYAVVGPWLLDHDILRVADPAIAQSPGAYRAWVKTTELAHAIPLPNAEAIHAAIRSKWSVWPGTALMVSASLVAFAFRFRVVFRAVAGLGKAFRRGPREEDPIAAVEVPTRWFVIGLVVCGSACVYMQRAWFEVPILEGILAVLLAFLLSVVAARATGETNITPIGAMGKIAQLTFGILVPGNASANLMTATVTAGSTCHSADLLTEVKVGYLLGASPRKQMIAQILGVFAGAAVCVPIYALIAKPDQLGTTLAAPAAVAWASVAKLLKDGAHNLPSGALTAIMIAVALGAVLAIADEVTPKRFKSWVPSATAIGIAFVIDANDSMAMCAGAVTAALLQRLRPSVAETYTVSAASGIVAGEGLMGIAIIFLRDVVHLLPK